MQTGLHEEQILSRKLIVVDHIARQIIDPQGNPYPGRSLVVTSAMITEACLAVGEKKLASTNKANFSKDILRSLGHIKWVPWLTALRWTIRQKYGSKGDGENFEFVRFEPGETPHPDYFPYRHLDPPLKVTPSGIRRKLRNKKVIDEVNLLHMCEQSQLFNTHFAQSDECVVELLENDTYNKKGWVETDALYDGRVLVGGRWRTAIISVEAKGIKDRVLLDQLKAQIAKAAADTRLPTADEDQKAAEYIVAVAVATRAFDDGKRICVYSSAPVAIKTALEHFDQGTIQLVPYALDHAASYVFNPPIPSLLNPVKAAGNKRTKAKE